jgi:hypothetical protein
MKVSTETSLVGAGIVEAALRTGGEEGDERVKVKERVFYINEKWQIEKVQQNTFGDKFKFSG